MAIRKIDLMYRCFGKCPGHACRECSNLIKGSWDHSKCKVYGNTRSEASDWAQRWEACGMFNKTWNRGPVMHLVRRDRNPKQAVEPEEDTVTENQVSLF